MFSGQGLDSSSSNDSRILLLDVFIEDNITFADDSRQTFLQQSNDLHNHRTKVIGYAVFKTFTDFFSTAINISDNLIKEKNIAGKAFIDQLIEKQTKNESKEIMIQFAYDFLNNELKKYTDTLSK